MTVTVYRLDETNVGDWFCAPNRYYPLSGSERDIMGLDTTLLVGHVVVGGGGLIAKTFHGAMTDLAAARPQLRSLTAWGVGESEHVARDGQFVPPYAGDYPLYLDAFDLVGVRDFGTRQRWVPCASCLHPLFDHTWPILGTIGIYQHKRIAIPIDGLPRRSNTGQDLERAIRFLGSYEVIITNSYHGAYWATLLGRRVIAIPNMSKMYRMAHPPVICRAERWQRYVDATRTYPDALAECRAANECFYADVRALHGARPG